MKARFQAFICGTSLAISTANALAGGWTQFRGSNHDGTSTETIRLDWAQNPPRTLWKVPMPNGLSSFSVDNGRLYTMGARQFKEEFTEMCLALDANTGQELWASPVGTASYPNGGVGSDDGTRATPTIDGDLVYAFGAYMNLVCFNATTGAKVWNHDLPTEFGATVIAWQNAASPLLVGDLILVNGNGRAGERLMAFRKTDGALVWKTADDAMTQSTPIVATLGGVDQAIFFAQSGLVAMAPQTGKVLWRYPITYNGVSVGASPVVLGDQVYASRAYPTHAGAVLVQVTGTGGSFTATKVWEKPNQLMNHWATPVYYDGYFYGMYGQQQSSIIFRAVDATNGDIKWTMTGFDAGSVTRVKDKLLALGEDGTLALVDTNPEAYTELARIQPVEGRCWNNPAVSDGRIYVRSTTEAVALDVSVAAPASPLRISIDFSGAMELALTVQADDGTPIDQAQAAQIEISFTDSLAAGTNWKPLAAAANLVAGQLAMTTALPGTAARYFRAQRNQ